MAKYREARRSFCNVAEEKAAVDLEARGFHVTKRGWPDLFCTRPGKKGERLAFVEVKPDARPLKASQLRLMRVLQQHGIPCFRWDPVGGLQPFDWMAERKKIKDRRRRQRKLGGPNQRQVRHPLDEPLWRLAKT